MRIAFVLDSFPPYISGVSIHYINLTRKLIEKGHKVMIIAPKTKVIKLPKGLEKCKLVFVRSIPVGVAKNMRLGTPSTLKTLLQLAKFKADIVEIAGPTFIGIDSLLASKILEIPSISYFHTLITSKDYLGLITLIGKTKALEKASWIYNRWFYNSSDAVLAPTKGVGRILSKNRIDKRIIIAPLFTDLRESKDISTQEISQLKKQLHLKTNVALFLGRLSKEKKLDDLLSIWALVVDKNPDSTLLVVGDGKYKKNLIKRVRKLKLEKHVVLTGELNHEQILDSGIIKVCDVYVSASVSETFGIAGLEAMINGLPVVLTKSQGLCELVDGAGFICPENNLAQFANSILKIFSNPKLKQKMSERAKTVAAKISSGQAIEKIIKIYEGIIESYERNLRNKSRFKLF